MKYSWLFPLLFSSFLIFQGCSPSPKDNPIDKDPTTPEEEEEFYESDFAGWNAGDPTIVAGSVPVHREFVVLQNANDEQFFLTEEKVSIVEIEEGVYQLQSDNENQDPKETIKRIGTFNHLGNIAYSFETHGTTGSYEDHVYELTMDTSEKFWELNNIGSDNLNTLLSDPEQLSFYQHTDDDMGLLDKMQKNWSALTEIDREWVVYNECMYGSGGLYFDFKDKWLEFSGGGDAYSQIIDTLIVFDEYVKIHYHSEMWQDAEPTIAKLYLLEDNILVFKRGDSEERFVASNNTEGIKTIDEECDEEEF